MTTKEKLDNRRHGSAIPVSCHEYESAVIPVNLDKVWHVIKNFKLEEVLPSKVKSTKYISGGPMQLGSMIRVDYVDGAHWEIRINEISDMKHSIGYEVIDTSPPHCVTSIQGIITLRHITDEDSTFMEWITDFSNDADATIIEDQRYKKIEFFKEMKKTFSQNK